MQLHCHRNFQKTHYPEISVQSPGSNRASASRLQRLFKRNRLCVLSPTPHYGRREKESGKREIEGENLRGEGKAPLERLPLSPWVVSLKHSSDVIAQNSEPEKCYPAKGSIGSQLSEYKHQTFLLSGKQKLYCLYQTTIFHNQKQTRCHKTAGLSY